jgi:hypothetical protein
MAKGTAVADEKEAAGETEAFSPGAAQLAAVRERQQAAAKRAAAPAPIRIRVTFDEPAEWLQEIEEAADLVDRRVVRFILRYDPPGEGYGVHEVELVAGAVVGGEIVELVAKAGAVWNDGGAADLETKKRVDTWHSQLVELCSRARLVLKGGRFGAV